MNLLPDGSFCQPRNFCASGAGPARPRVWGLPAVLPRCQPPLPSRLRASCLSLPVFRVGLVPTFQGAAVSLSLRLASVAGLGFGAVWGWLFGQHKLTSGGAVGWRRGFGFCGLMAAGVSAGRGVLLCDGAAAPD